MFKYFPWGVLNAATLRDVHTLIRSLVVQLGVVGGYRVRLVDHVLDQVMFTITGRMRCNFLMWFSLYMFSREMSISSQSYAQSTS